MQAGLNLYLYCRAGPVTYVDPDGMEESKAQPIGMGKMGICPVENAPSPSEANLAKDSGLTVKELRAMPKLGKPVDDTVA